MNDPTSLSLSTARTAVAGWALLLISGCRPPVVAQPVTPETAPPADQTPVVSMLVEVDIEARRIDPKGDEMPKVELTLVWGPPDGPKTSHVLRDEVGMCSLLPMEEPLDSVYMSCWFAGEGANYTVTHEGDELVVDRIETSEMEPQEGDEPQEAYEPEGEHHWRVPVPSNVRVQWPSP